MDEKKPQMSFTFKVNDYRKRSNQSLPPLTFYMGSYKDNPQPPFVKLCHYYLDYLMKKDINENFRTIDDVINRDSSYAEIVKHPMDFLKIREKLNRNQYQDIKEFKYDVDLIWQNCIQFNGTFSEIGIYSMRLRSNFNELWDLHNSIKDGSVKDALRSIKLKDDAKSVSDDTNIDLFKFPPHPIVTKPAPEKIKRIKEKSVTHSIRHPIEVKSERLNENLTADEKQKLARRIDNCIPALLGDVIDILRDSLNLDLSKENIIPFSDIGTPVLRKIEAVMKEAKNKEQSVKRMYQNEQMPSEKQLEILKRENKKFEELLSKKFTGGSESSSDNDTDTADSSDMDNTSSSEDTDS